MLYRAVMYMLLLLMLAAWVVFVIHTMSYLHKLEADIEITEQIQDSHINSLQLQIEDYERINAVLPVLRTIVSPMQWLEIRGQAEALKQEKEGKCYE